MTFRTHRHFSINGLQFALRRPGPSRRGSTFIVVLALLSLLVLIATALSLTSRLEVISAANYADGIQARMAAKVGLGVASTRALGLGSTSSTSEINYTASGAPLHHFIDGLDPRILQTQWKVSLADVWVQDACARINLNTADEDTLARLFTFVANRTGIRDASPRDLARAIVEGRTKKSETGSSNSSQTAQPIELPKAVQQRLASAAKEFSIAPLLEDSRQADLRVPPLEGEARWRSIAELLPLPGASPALVSATAPFLTVFSVAPKYADLPTGILREQVDLNQADAYALYEMLRAVYPESVKEDRLLRQFAVNLVDWRDTDSEPTVFPGSEGAETILGLERTPFVVEVWPNSLYPEESSGAGQYVELYNPWNEWIEISNWTLRHSAWSIPLRGRIAPGGYLILTDVFDGLSLAGNTGENPFDSFYSIFRAVDNGTTRRILEASDLRLSSNPGIYSVELRNAEGRLIDVFSYRIEYVLRGQKTSYQRADPRIRLATAARCTPFAPKPGTMPLRESSGEENRYPADRPFLNPVEMFRVFAGWAHPITGRGAAGPNPVLATPESPASEFSEYASSPNYLDGRLLDGFGCDPRILQQQLESLAGSGKQSASRQTALLGAGKADLYQREIQSGPSPSHLFPIPQTVRDRLVKQLAARLESAEDLVRFEKARAENDSATLAALALRTFTPPAADVRLGGVNLNTAPEAVLAALPGLDERIAQEWTLERRRRLVEPALAEQPMFRRPSDLLKDAALWRAWGSTEVRAQRLGELLSVAAFSTRSVVLDSRTTPVPASSAGRAPATSRALALVAFDRGPLEYVAWGPIP